MWIQYIAIAAQDKGTLYRPDEYIMNHVTTRENGDNVRLRYDSVIMTIIREQSFICHLEYCCLMG